MKQSNTNNNAVWKCTRESNMEYLCSVKRYEIKSITLIMTVDVTIVTKWFNIAYSKAMTPVHLSLTTSVFQPSEPQTVPTNRKTGFFFQPNYSKKSLHFKKSHLLFTASHWGHTMNLRWNHTERSVEANSASVLDNSINHNPFWCARGEANTWLLLRRN